MIQILVLYSQFIFVNKILFDQNKGYNVGWFKW